MSWDDGQKPGHTQDNTENPKAEILSREPEDRHPEATVRSPVLFRQELIELPPFQALPGRESLHINLYRHLDFGQLGVLGASGLCI